MWSANTKHWYDCSSIESLQIHCKISHMEYVSKMGVHKELQKYIEMWLLQNDIVWTDLSMLSVDTAPSERDMSSPEPGAGTRKLEGIPEVEVEDDSDSDLEEALLSIPRLPECNFPDLSISRKCWSVEKLSWSSSVHGTVVAGCGKREGHSSWSFDGISPPCSPCRLPAVSQTMDLMTSSHRTLPALATSRDIKSRSTEMISNSLGGLHCSQDLRSYRSLDPGSWCCDLRLSPCPLAAPSTRHRRTRSLPHPQKQVGISPEWWNIYVFFQFEIIVNVLVSSFRSIWIHMLWV